MTIQPWERDPDTVAYQFITADGMKFIANRPDLADQAERFMVSCRDPDWRTDLTLGEWLLEYADQLPGDVVSEGYDIWAEMCAAKVA